jgi:hypothetical protein
MGTPLAPEVAEKELQSIIEFWEVNPEGAGWEASRARLLHVIGAGRLTLDKEIGVIRLTLVKSIELENSQTLAALELHEPTSDDMRVMDKYSEKEKVGATLHLASKMTGQPLGVINRMVSRDVSSLGAIASLFF